MILKNKDGRQADIQELNRLLTLSPTAKQRFLIERELKCLASGERNEQNSAYYLDFKYKDSENWVVIHDLRLEHRGRVAQIDHLLINRVLDIFVLESKNYYYGVKISEEGGLLLGDGKTDQAIFKFAGPGRQPGGFLYWPKESHQRKCLMALRSAFLVPAFRAVNDRCRNEPG